MGCPPWIDDVVSKEIPLLRDRGEDQYCEFMKEFPRNAHELSKEIAAFASSNTGIIIIGVDDDGTIIGIDKVGTQKERDGWFQRVEGVCSGSVRPAITPEIKFAKDGEATLLVIKVPRGAQPIYYCSNTPYIRHVTRSRPADPHEVVEKISQWLRSISSNQSEEYQEFYAELHSVIIDVLIYGPELDRRADSPWLGIIRTQFGSAGSTLRKLAANDLAMERGISEELTCLADALEAASYHRLLLGRQSWEELASHVADGVQIAERLLYKLLINRRPVELRKTMTDLGRPARELADLVRRADVFSEQGRIKELQEAISRIGYSIIALSYSPVEEQNKAFNTKVRNIGRSLHLIETEIMFIDGGRSIDRLLNNIRRLNLDLQELVAADV